MKRFIQLFTTLLFAFSNINAQENHSLKNCKEVVIFDKDWNTLEVKDFSKYGLDETMYMENEIFIPNGLLGKAAYLGFLYNSSKNSSTKYYAELFTLTKNSMGKVRPRAITTSKGENGEIYKWKRGYGYYSKKSTVSDVYRLEWNKIDSLNNFEWKKEKTEINEKNNTFTDALTDANGETKYYTFKIIDSNSYDFVSNRILLKKETDNGQYIYSYDTDNELVSYVYSKEWKSRTLSKKYVKDVDGNMKMIWPAMLDDVDAFWYTNNDVITPKDRWNKKYSMADLKSDSYTKINFENIDIRDNQDYTLEVKVTQPEIINTQKERYGWENARIGYKYIVHIPFEENATLRLDMDFNWSEWKQTISYSIKARGIELFADKVTRSIDDVDMYTNSNTYNISRVGESFLIAVNSKMIANLDVSLTPSGKVSAGWFNGKICKDKYSCQNTRKSFETFGLVQCHLTNYNATQKGIQSSNDDNAISLGNLLGTGSGVVIDENAGYILTNHHVTESGKSYEVEIDNKKYEAILIRSDPNNDLAIIKLLESPSSLLSIPINISGSLGEKIYSAGFPRLGQMGKDIKITEGIISSVSFLNDPSKFQISCPITNGNSGGALIDKNGNLVGITQGGWRPDENTENVNAAVKSIYVIALAQSQEDCNINLNLRNTEIDFSQLKHSVLPIYVYD